MSTVFNALLHYVVWVVIGVVAWLLVGLPVAMFFGRVINLRDRQRPPEITDDEADGQRLAEVRYIRSRTEPGYPIDVVDEAMQRHPASRSRDEGEAP